MKRILTAGVAAAFGLVVLVTAVHGQTTTPTTSPSATTTTSPTPTSSATVPSGAPSTGFGR